MFYALRNRSKNVDIEDVRKGRSEQVALGEVNLGCSRLSARGGGEGTWVDFSRVCAAGLLELLPDFSKIQLVVYYQCCVLIG